MKKKEKIFQEEKRYLCNTYQRLPIVLERGKGTKVWDCDGKEYLDFISGIAVLNLGHSHPKILREIKRQANTLIHTSNLFYTVPQIKLAKILVENSFASKVFFCNSGAEANEAAIKLCRKYFKDRGQPHRWEIITMEGSFHGRTLATLSATGH